MLLAVTLKLATVPTVFVWLCGWLAIAGMDHIVRVATVEVTAPTVFVSTTV